MPSVSLCDLVAAVSAQCGKSLFYHNDNMPPCTIICWWRCRNYLLAGSTLNCLILGGCKNASMILVEFC